MAQSAATVPLNIKDVVQCPDELGNDVICGPSLRHKAKDPGLKSPTSRVLNLQELINLLRNPIHCGKVWVKGTKYCEKGVEVEARQTAAKVA